MYLVEPAVDASVDVPRAVGLTAVAQPAYPLGQLVILGHDQATVTECTEILGRIKTERASDPERSDRPTIGCRKMRLAAVFDEQKPVSAGNRQESRHVRGLPIKMHGHDGRGPGRDGGQDGLRIEREPLRVDVGEDRTRTDHLDRKRSVGGRERRGHDLVTRSDAEPPQDERERVGAGSDANRVRGTARDRELLLERLDLRPQHEPATVDHPVDGRLEDLGLVARLQAQEGYPEVVHVSVTTRLPSRSR